MSTHPPKPQGKGKRRVVGEGTGKGQGVEMIYGMAAAEFVEGVSDLNRLLFDDDIRKDTVGELKEKGEELIALARISPLH